MSTTPEVAPDHRILLVQVDQWAGRLLSILPGSPVSTTTQQLGFAGSCCAGVLRRTPVASELLGDAGFRTTAIDKAHARSIGASRWSFTDSLPTSRLFSPTG